MFVVYYTYRHAQVKVQNLELGDEVNNNVSEALQVLVLSPFQHCIILICAFLKYCIMSGVLSNELSLILYLLFLVIFFL